jgi:hypothetical protein
MSVLIKESCLHSSDDKKQGEVHPDGTVKAVSAKVVGDVGNHDEHEGGQAGGQHEAEQLPLELRWKSQR